MYFTMLTKKFNRSIATIFHKSAENANTLTVKGRTEQTKGHIFKGTGVTSETATALLLA